MRKSVVSLKLVALVLGLFTGAFAHGAALAWPTEVVDAYRAILAADSKDFSLRKESPSVLILEKSLRQVRFERTGEIHRFKVNGRELDLNTLGPDEELPAWLDSALPANSARIPWWLPAAHAAAKFSAEDRKKLVGYAANILKDTTLSDNCRISADLDRVCSREIKPLISLLSSGKLTARQLAKDKTLVTTLKALKAKLKILRAGGSQYVEKRICSQKLLHPTEQAKKGRKQKDVFDSFGAEAKIDCFMDLDMANSSLGLLSVTGGKELDSDKMLNAVAEDLQGIRNDVTRLRESLGRKKTRAVELDPAGGDGDR